MVVGMPEPGAAIWAHSENQAGVLHHLDDHLRGTAALASRFAEQRRTGTS
jgi:hypothetical protein